MSLTEIAQIGITGAGRNRILKCCYCSATLKRSILPHMRTEHPREWDKWRDTMLSSFNQGENPKQIMKGEFTSGNRPVFTWNVIEKELSKMIEEGRKIEPHCREKITSWTPANWRRERSTIWEYRHRGSWATHSGSYRGNWSPEIPRNVILRYSKPKDLVLDPFVGGGTTLIESRLLGRNAIGYDVNPYAVLITKKQLSVVEKEAKRQKRRLPAAKIRIANHDSRSLATLKASSIDLICTHPPYFNSLRYTRGDNRDLSSMDDLDSFIQIMGGIAREFLRVLKAGRMCAIMMGDVRIDGKIYPLGFETMEAFKNAGFVLSEIVIKRQFNDRSSGFYTKSRFLRISHEYLFIFRKKAG